MIAEVLVDIAHMNVDQVFDYEVSVREESVIAIGQRVKVPFQGRTLTGFVVGLKETSAIEKLKTITAILDLTPYFDLERLDLASRLSYEYAYPRAAYLNAMLPNALKMRYRKHYVILDPEALPERLNALSKDGAIDAKTVDEDAKKAIKKHLESGDLIERIHITNKARVKTVDFIILKKDDVVKGHRQKAIIDTLKTHGGMEKHGLLKTAKATDGPLRSLLEKGIVERVSEERYRELKSLYELSDKPVRLTGEQARAKRAIEAKLDTYHPFLLHGVTSSGKTEIYIKLVRDVLAIGKGAIILLPEISLTPKITARFKSVFGDEVAVLHSRLSINEHYDQWRRILRGEAHVVIGARSAIFAPVKSIGLIVIDESHSESYIQNDAPRYSALDVARNRAKTHQAPLVLGSATPSVESMYEARMGAMTLLRLKNRALKAELPTIRLADMRQAFLDGNTSIFSSALKSAIDKRLEKGEQTLLLINRRGHSRFVLCRTCGKTIRCENCGIPMTYHKDKHQLICHYCNHKEPMPSTCPHCGSPHIRYMGLGSEQAEEAIRKTFQKANVFRLDHDSTTTKHAHEEILHTFEHEGDILVGTQMIAKGLDFENVTLVGVLSADMGFHVPDFYAESETFALLTQISGRAGRRRTKGEVIIQAYDVDHPVLEDVKNGDYERFYEREIAYREQAGLPPFKKLTQITIGHADYNTAYKKALEWIRILKMKVRNAKVLGPIRPMVPRTKDRHFTQILIKHEAHPSLYDALNTIIKGIDFSAYQISVDHYPRAL
ncbi:MAG: primosomal protein N' [Candidatus Izemoplasmataceae bacterium]